MAGFNPTGTVRRFVAAPGAQLGLVMVVALGVRVALLLSVAHLPWFSLPMSADSAVYDNMARVFARGDYLIGTEPLRMSPAYPFLLGVVYRLFGDGPWSIRLVQSVLGVILVGLTWDTARQLAGDRIALVAGSLVAIFGPVLFYETQLLSDAPAAAVAALALWAMVRAAVQVETRPWRWALVGLATGVVVLFRPNAVLLAVPLIAAAAWTGSAGPSRTWPLVAALLGFVAGLSPTPVRNLLATGHPTLLAAHGGINLYVGNGPGATGSFRIPDEMPQANEPRRQLAAFQLVAERAVGHPLDDEAVDRYWMDRTLTYVIEHPDRWLMIVLMKLRLFWNGSSISDMENYDFTRALNRVLGLPFVQWWLLMPFALLGTLLALRSRGPTAVVALFNLAWCASLAIVFVVDRYRLPALSGLAVTAALAGSELQEMWIARSRTLRVVLVAVVAGSVIGTWPVPVGTDMAYQWWKLGMEFEYTGRLEEARSAYQNALRIAPDDQRSRARLQLLDGTYQNTLERPR